jgi:hypothetical protein
MLPLWRYQEARELTTFHGQVKLLSVETTRQTPANVQVDAEICRVFRGPAPYRPGLSVRFAVSVLTGKEPLESVPIGGTRWTNYRDLLWAKYMEVFLNGDPPACQIALWQSAIIDAPSSQPVLDSGNPIQVRSLRLWRWLRRIARKGSGKGMKNNRYIRCSEASTVNVHVVRCTSHPVCQIVGIDSSLLKC